MRFLNAKVFSTFYAQLIHIFKIINPNMYRYLFCLISLFLSYGLLAQGHLLKTAPMIGHNDGEECTFWVQTTEEAEVKIAFWQKGTTDTLYTESISTDPASFFCTKLHAKKLRPYTRYEYLLFINGSPFYLKNAAWRTPPTARMAREAALDLDFAFGSCYFRQPHIAWSKGESYGGGYQIFEAIAEEEPDMMIWGGDNLYFREEDWQDEASMAAKYQFSRTLPALQPLLRSTIHYAIWDDHDYGPNNSNASFENKEASLKSFERFWANPPRVAEGIYTQFSHGDLDFFLTDNRSFRSAQDGIVPRKRVLLGQKQLDWLKQALLGSEASFKFVVMGGQFLSDAAVYENAANFPTEREELLSFIKKNQIQNVIFLTGDRHASQCSRIFLESGVYVYDLTVSPLTSGPFSPEREQNNNLIPSSTVTHRNFAHLKVESRGRKRQLNIRLLDAEGELFWFYRILQQ